MDRFACYLPGWEMPKNSSEYLTSNYGFITDYLAEAFHHQFKHTNRYEEVNKRIRLGSAVEGRDEKGIKKTVCAFLKILHPDGPPSRRGVRGVRGLRRRVPPARQGADEQAQAGRRVRAASTCPTSTPTARKSSSTARSRRTRSRRSSRSAGRLRTSEAGTEAGPRRRRRRLIVRPRQAAEASPSSRGERHRRRAEGTALHDFLRRHGP